MIHYHGTPVTPVDAARELLTRRHGLVSFENPAQMPLVAEVCQSFVIDNGAYSKWMEAMRKAERTDVVSGAFPAFQVESRVDVEAYAAFVREWERHPGFDWCLIPDVIDGTEFDNDQMIARWCAAGMRHGVPVWHLHESLDRLKYFARCYDRVALGSSGQWATIGTPSWWARMDEVREAICDDRGRPVVKLHGLRMLSPEVFLRIPLASADSCNVAVNIGVDKRWTGPYQPLTAKTRALVMAERIEQRESAAVWERYTPEQFSLELTA